jgi:hypothetical protein
MNSHYAIVPAVAETYFVSRGIFTHPVIVQAFHPRRGWITYPIRKRISQREARQLRREGYTDISLRAGGRTADFRLQELTEKTGLALSRLPYSQ